MGNDSYALHLHPSQLPPGEVLSQKEIEIKDLPWYFPFMGADYLPLVNETVCVLIFNDNITQGFYSNKNICGFVKIFRQQLLFYFSSYFFKCESNHVYFS